MQTEVMEKCDLLVQNRNLIYRGFMLEDSLMQVIAATAFVDRDEITEVKAIKECRKLLRKKHSAFSYLRGNNELFISSKMALSDDPEQYFNNVSEAYKKIHQGKQLETSYMALAAMLICDLGRQVEADELVSKAEQIKSRMNKEHPVLTDSEDTSFIMFLALTDKSVDTIISDIDEAYDYLEKTCKVKVSANALQGLCEVLAISYGDTKEKCDKVVRIFNTFSEHGTKYGTDSEFIVLGSLIDVNVDTDTLVREILEAEVRLADLKGFKDAEMDRKKRMMYASMLVADVYGMQTAVIGNSLISHAMTTVITKQIASAISIAVNLATMAIPEGDKKGGDKE